ncbi:immunity 52 family protein [Roseobacter weihaiensis]|uniref:immunity 52 family protein n=1 Tax=Roseobacter weihaiensis TaxID=2763262 RepID=UPI001D0BC46B|nr:immunity 52 family protein [Roseobacter sp. H9]
MGAWLERWLAAGKPIDLDLMAKLTPHRYGHEYQDFEDGARDFLRLLRLADHLPICGLGWALAEHSLWAQENEYLAAQISRGASFEYADSGGFARILDNALGRYGIDETHYEFKHRWGDLNNLSVEFDRFHPEYPKYSISAEQVIALVEVITRWKRPMHLECGPFDYFRDHHPLDRARRGIRWVGWVPFALNPSDVPEAARVQQMNGGTLIATQMDFWQCFEHHPLYSKEAIERAQEVEIRLNLLGVLPTAVELDRGDWGVVR